MAVSPRYDVVALGELIVDLVPARGADGQACFAAKAGGAPGNVAVGVARLGGSAAMLSKVGEEAFGRLLVATLAGYGVATQGVVLTPERNTALAVVTLSPEGDRDFIFYRNGCADASYAPEEVDVDLIRAARMLHVGSLVLAQPVAAAAQRRAVQVAREAGVLVSADVNLRPSLWPEPEAMRAAALATVTGANLVKISEEELTFLTGEQNPDDGIARLWHSGLRAVALTLGAAGAMLVTAHDRVTVPGFPVKVVDTVGCGDAFMASLLTDVAAAHGDLGAADTLERWARRACANGALTATGAGAMESLPTAERRDAFLASHGF